MTTQIARIDNLGNYCQDVRHLLDIDEEAFARFANVPLEELNDFENHRTQHGSLSAWRILIALVNLQRGMRPQEPWTGDPLLDPSWLDSIGATATVTMTPRKLLDVAA